MKQRKLGKEEHGEDAITVGLMKRPIRLQVRVDPDPHRPRARLLWSRRKQLGLESVRRVRVLLGGKVRRAR